METIQLEYCILMKEIISIINGKFQLENVSIEVIMQRPKWNEAFEIVH